MKSTVESPLPPGPRILEGRAVRVGVGDVREARDQPAQPAGDLGRLRAERRGRGRFAVVGAVEADDHGPPGRAAHHLDGDLDRLGAVEGDVVAGEALRRDRRAAARPSSAVSSVTSEWLSSFPNRSTAAIAGSRISRRPAPSGTDAEAEMQSRKTLPSASVTVQPALPASSEGAGGPRRARRRPCARRARGSRGSGARAARP